MIILFQLLIFIIILIASSYGFKALIPVIILIIIFSFLNIFTLELLAVQSTTILVAGGIGVLICTVRLLVTILSGSSKTNSSTEIEDNYSKDDHYDNYYDDKSFDFVPSFLIVNFLRFCISSVGTFLFMSIYRNYRTNSYIELLAGLIFIATVVFTVLIGHKISYKHNSAIEESSSTSFTVALICFLVGAFIGTPLLHFIFTLIFN